MRVRGAYEVTMRPWGYGKAWMYVSAWGVVSFLGCCMLGCLHGVSGDFHE